MFREFQNSIKYHEESLEKLEAPVLQPPCLPNREYTSACFPYHRANINLVGWSIFSTNRNANDIYASPDSLILKTNPHLHVANFSASAIMVQIGQVLGKGHNPNSWLDHMGNVRNIHKYPLFILGIYTNYSILFLLSSYLRLLFLVNSVLCLEWYF